MRLLYSSYRDWAFNAYKKLEESFRKDNNEGLYFATIKGGFETKGHHFLNRPFIIDPTGKSNDLKNVVEELNLDVILFYGWSWIVPKVVLDSVPCVCLHPSPLPLYRGGSPIQHQILNDEEDSAVTIFLMTEGLDDGPILYQERFRLRDCSIRGVYNKMEEVAALKSYQLMQDFLSKKVEPVPQDHSKATVYKRRTPSESELKPSEVSVKPFRYILNFVRALQPPYPEPFVVLAEGVRLLVCRISNTRDKTQILGESGGGIEELVSSKLGSDLGCYFLECSDGRAYISEARVVRV